MSEYSCIDTGEGYYRCFNAYPTVNSDDVTTGLRSAPLKSCHYWVKGMANICTYWSKPESRCTYRDNNTHIPSGWNNGKCDFLGRRSICDRYNTNEEHNLDQYMCIAPNAFISGLYTPVASGVLLRSIDKSEIEGYNEEDGVGRCDGYGRGTAVAGTDTPVADVDDRRVICSYYRPWQMGFGSLKPHPIDIRYRGRQRIITQDAIDEAYTLVGQPMERQLPFDFKIFNLRAKIQKCAFWDSDYPAEFVLNPENNMIVAIKPGGDVSDINDHINYNLDLTSTNFSPCKCNDSSARPYTTTDFSSGSPDYMMLALVWSEDAHTIVCNGAKPECPCYTGQWKYCIDTKMGVGQRITANQILELRFWSHDWETQEDYERYWEKIPGTNPNDPTTADIYTFTLWRTIESSDTPMDSIMEGRRVSICMPANIIDKKFSSDYIQIENVTYPRATVDLGTAIPSSQSFPTLIRDLTDEYERRFQVIYPYVGAESPFNYQPCEEIVPSTFIKRSFSIDDDTISVIGSTVRNKDVYVVTPDLIAQIDYLLDDYNSMASVPEDQRDNLYNRIQERVSYYLRYKPEEIYYTKSDNETGFFRSDPVKLKYQEYNSLLIFVDYNDGTWDFRKRIVWSQFYGGMIVQSSFSHTYSDEGAFSDSQPEYFSPSATLNGSVKKLVGNNGLGCLLNTDDLFSVYSLKVESLTSLEEYYTYCKKNVTIEDYVCERWGQIYGTAAVWLEIDDLNLNYIFECNIIEVKMVSLDTESTEEIEMEVLYPTSQPEQRTILPNAFIIKPADGKYRGFFRNEYDLVISYEYEKIDTTDELLANEEISFPSSGFTSSAGVNKYFIEPPFDLERSDDAFIISNLGIRRGAVAVMAMLTDETGRLMSATATKLCTMVTTNKCRSIAINYMYNAVASNFILEPSTGFPTYIDADRRTGETRLHISTPPCGDHLMSRTSNKGPVWYPFNACSDSDFYNVINPANFCASPKGRVGTAGVDYITGLGGIVYRSDHRMSCPSAYECWVGTGGNWAATCGAAWTYYYSFVPSIDNTIFSGYVKRRKSVDALYYQFNNWELPPFGNVDREYLERWISQDYISYNIINPGGTSLITKYEYVPMVIDNTTLYMSFNVFEKDPYDSGIDCFSFINQMNLLLSNTVQEKVEVVSDEDPTRLRYRFDEVFSMKFHSYCSYPLPVYLISNNITSVTYYLFKDNSVTWAWQERWKDIERQSGDNRLTFVDYERPEYQYSYFKEEFRYICDEGIYTIKYTKPEIEEGNFVKYPSISIDGGEPRYFNVLYSSYGDTQVDWVDSNDGAVGGSGGDENNVYELTSGSNWNHSSNILFDSEAVGTIEAATLASRRIIEDYDSLLEPPETYKYFNRGIIANILKSRLKYLPYEESQLVDGFEPTLLVDDNSYGNMEYSWYDVSPTLEYSLSDNICISKIVITGEMGVIDEDAFENQIIACKPGVIVRSADYPSGVLYSSQYEVGMDDEQVDFEIVIELDINPKNMLQYRLGELSIELECYDDQYISINSPVITIANYIDKEESIYVYERKYMVSKADTTNGSLLGDVNLDSTNTPITYKQSDGASSGGAGVYFPGHYTGTSSHDSLKAIDKLRLVCSSKAYEDDETVVTTYNTLRNIERDEQGALYEYSYNLDTYGDEFLYTITMPPSIADFLNEMVDRNIFNGYSTFIADKLPWEKHYLKSLYTEYDFWRGQGHKYQWSPDYFTARCYLYGPVERVYDANFIHMDSGQTYLATSPMNTMTNKKVYADTWYAYQGY